MLIIMPMMPQTDVESAPERIETQLKIRMKTPVRLSAIPATPLQVILSFMTIADIIRVMIGLSVLIMEASMAVVFVMANRKETWVRNSPRNDARAIFQKSPFSIRSFLPVTADHSQNSAVAPKDRRQNNAIGVILPSMEMFLQLIMLNPNMAYAAKQAKFPTKAPFLFIETVI